MVVGVLIGMLCMVVVGRIVYVLYDIQRGADSPLVLQGSGVSTLVVLGSGGHTGEMLRLVAALDPRRYTPRVYLTTDTDTVSTDRLRSTEQDIQGEGEHDDCGAEDKDKNSRNEYTIEVIPRSREVGQGWTSSLFTSLWALVFCILVVARHRPALVLANGPGTCVPVCLAALGLRILGVCPGRVVFVESLCRVKSLSLSGRILYHLVDHFFVQWPALLQSHPRSRYLGRLV